MSEPIIRVEHLEKKFGTTEVLRDISFSVEQGDVVSIIGVSGTGKSTMLRCINLLEQPTSGKIYFHGEDILSPHFDLSRYRASVGMVFQQFNLFNNLTVLENCVVPQIKVLRRSREEAEHKAKDYLESVGMLQYCNARPAQISGGQKQRVAIAGILAMKPSILIFDEATAMLDPKGKKEIKKLMYDLAAAGDDITILSITHDIEEVLQSDDCVVLNKGKLFMHDKPEKVFAKADVLRKIDLDIPFVEKVREQFAKKKIRLKANEPEGMVEELCRYRSNR
jgi:putative lysine transport system ATP-binding protein